MNRRNSEAAQRFAERRRREDEAPRLAAVAPALATLRIDFKEGRAGGQLADVSYVRHIIVERAPALFELPCQDTACRDGGHDLTADILRGLRERAPTFSGQDTCQGQVGAASCRRVLSFVATATYRG